MKRDFREDVDGSLFDDDLFDFDGNGSTDMMEMFMAFELFDGFGRKRRRRSEQPNNSPQPQDPNQNRK